MLTSQPKAFRCGVFLAIDLRILLFIRSKVKLKISISCSQNLINNIENNMRLGSHTKLGATVQVVQNSYTDHVRSVLNFGHIQHNSPIDVKIRPKNSKNIGIKGQVNKCND
jgi:hypothetical protein